MEQAASVEETHRRVGKAKVREHLAELRFLPLKNTKSLLYF